MKPQHQPSPYVLVGRSIKARYLDGSGIVAVDLTVAGPVLVRTEFQIGDTSGRLEAATTNSGICRLTGTAHLPEVERWWPPTHGASRTYPVSVSIDGRIVRLAPVGFRTVAVDRSDGGFSLLVDGRRIFARGIVWVPVDPVNAASAVAEARRQLEAEVTVTAHRSDGLVVEEGRAAVRVTAGSAAGRPVALVLDGFRDLGRAYRFGRQTVDAIVATLRGDAGTVLSTAVELPGFGRPQVPDVGLRAAAIRGTSGWEVEVSTTLSAQSVAVDCDPHRPSRSWFHLPAGGNLRFCLTGGSLEHPPSGEVGALNSTATTPIAASATAPPAGGLDGR